MNCKTCRWWGAVKDFKGGYEKVHEVREGRFRRFVTEFVPYNCKPCGNPMVVTVDGDDERGVVTMCNLPSDGAGLDGYPYVPLSLVTGPDFGCVHWESQG